MMDLKYEFNKQLLDTQYQNIVWDTDSGCDKSELEKEILKLEEELKGHSKSFMKAKTFELLLQKGQIAISQGDIFQEKLNARDMMVSQRKRWMQQVSDKFIKYQEEVDKADELGVFSANPDFGHTSSDTKSLTEVGFVGLIERLERAQANIQNISETQRDFYRSSKIMLQAMADFCLRLSKADGIYPENAVCLENISNSAPHNLYEAMQILIVYFYLHEYIGGTRMRTLGRLDEILYPFYKKDIESGALTRDTAKTLWKYFLNKFWAMKVPFDMPFCIGGVNKQGEEVTNELSYLIVETYNELNIHSPKIHVRVSEKTPADFVKMVLRCIRGGNSSFVFANDDVAIKSMMKCGASLEEARNYVFIGCYEPAIYDLELPCTGNGMLNLAKTIELVFCNGRDLATGEVVGVETGEITSYEEFIAALKEQVTYLINKAMGYICEVEKYYMDINPDPILSAMLSPCVEKGVDAYAGGAKYNNSSYYISTLASFTDSVVAVKKIVFEEKRMTFQELGNILKANWKGNEKLRLEMLKSPEKYGNNIVEVDEIAVEFADFAAKLINGKPNSRGGIFKAGNFSIDLCFKNGKRTMATPDGRIAGEPLSKNLCSVTAMDKKGITGLINTVTKMDLSDFPDGSVLDIVLHPSAVQGEDGLEAFWGILKTYFAKGGLALHGNVFNVEDLKKAQQNPKEYANLQVRLCGWNVFFVNLSKEEQDAFIQQAENAC